MAARTHADKPNFRNTSAHDRALLFHFQCCSAKWRFHWETEGFQRPIPYSWKTLALKMRALNTPMMSSFTDAQTDTQLNPGYTQANFFKTHSQLLKLANLPVFLLFQQVMWTTRKTVNSVFKLYTLCFINELLKYELYCIENSSKIFICYNIKMKMAFLK